MKGVFVRTFLALALLPILAWAFATEFVRGIGQAFRYAVLDVRIEFGSFLRLWQEAGKL